MRRNLLLVGVLAAVLVGLSLPLGAAATSSTTASSAQSIPNIPAKNPSPTGGEVIWEPSGTGSGDFMVNVSFNATSRGSFVVFKPDTFGEKDVNNDTSVGNIFGSGTHTFNMNANPGENQWYIYHYGTGETSPMYSYRIPAVELRDSEGNFEVSSAIPFEGSITTASGDRATVDNIGGGPAGTNVLPLTDGYTELGELDEPITLDVTASGSFDYADRTVSYSEPVYEYVWLANETKPTINTTFALDDRTNGQFDPATTSLQITRSYNVSGDVEQRQVIGDVFGANGRITSTLLEDNRYRVQVSNEDGDTRGFGMYLANTDNDFVELQIGEISINPEQVGDYYFNAEDWTYTSSSTDFPGIEFYYSDNANATESLKVTVHEQGNENVQIFKETYTDANEVREQFLYSNGSNAKKSWVVEYNATRTVDNETVTVTGFQTIGDLAELKPPVSDQMLQALALGSILLVAGLFGGTLSQIGGVVVVAIAWVLYAIGWLTIPISFLLAAATIAVLYLVGSPDSGGMPT
jgi:hypothetical protein